MLLPDRYDDGGLSGGSMERPALRRLLVDTKEHRVDVVVVYKVDRLTRSLADFAKLTDLLDANDASFVSVTQQFNTSTSMGRLTLNVLLSFAQFEREVAGERIRDKIAMSKRRGMWMGGLPPLGYDGIDRKLVINEAEADTVRLIFTRYIEIGSVAALKLSLDAEGVVSKHRTFANGRTMGGVPISRGAFYQILRNRLYRGEIEHRGEVHAGQHQPIIDPTLWDTVQTRLAQHAVRSRGNKSTTTFTAPLAGLVFDAAGNRMTPTHAQKGGRRYYYYTSASLVRRHERREDSKGIRVPASDLERVVTSAIAERLADPAHIAELAGDAGADELVRIIEAAKRLSTTGTNDQATKYDSIAHAEMAGVEPTATVGPLELDVQKFRALVHRIEVAKDRVVISLDATPLLDALGIASGGLDMPDARHDALVIGVRTILQRRGKQTRLIIGAVDSEVTIINTELLKLIRDGHRWFDDLRNGTASSIAALAKRDGEQVSHVSRSITLAFLAPDILDMIIAGCQPPSLTPERLKSARPLPAYWFDQRKLLLA